MWGGGVGLFVVAKCEKEDALCPFILDLQDLLWRHLWLQDIFVFYFMAAFFSVTIEGEIHKHIYTHASGHTQTLMFHTVIKKFLLWGVSFSWTHVHVKWQHANDYLPADGILSTLLWIECFPFPFLCSEWCVLFSCSYIFDALCFMP